MSSIFVERVCAEKFSVINEVIKSIDSPSLLGYHTPAYMTILTRVLTDNPLYLVAYCGEKVAGLMPLRWREGAAGPVINGLPFFGPNGGPVFTAYGKNCQDLVMVQLARELKVFAEEMGAVSVACYAPFLDDANAFESAFSPDRVIDKFTQYLDLKGFTVWPSHIRHKSLGRAKGKGVTIRAGTAQDIPRLLAIYHENYERKGITLKPDAYFSHVVDQLCPLGIARFSVAEWENRVIACLVTIQAGITVSYNVPCCEQSAQTTQANSLLIDEAVRALVPQGYRFWNWESSPGRDSSVYKFKERWGSLEAHYKIFLYYPRGTKAFAGLSQQEIASEYPFYFVVPFEDLNNTNNANSISM